MDREKQISIFAQEVIQAADRLNLGDDTKPVRDILQREFDEVENETAERIADWLASGWRLRDKALARAIRRGEWRKKEGT